METAVPTIAKPQPFRVNILDGQVVRLMRKLEDCELPESDIIEVAGSYRDVSLEGPKSQEVLVG